MDVERQENTNILDYLLREDSFMYRQKLDAPFFALWNCVPDPYMRCGCHPEIVERLWDQIGPALPKDCRGIVCLTPALVHPQTGIILALAMGTEYVLRLPGTLGADAISKGARTVAKWSTGATTDIRRTFGDDWVFGAWLKDELTWCNRAYEMFTST
jgi:hypothetical protein